MVEKFLHTSDLLRVFLLFCLVKRISYSFPPCFLRCEPVFISYISPQMHHVDMALAQESPCVFHAIHLLEQERELLRIPPQPHAPGCADAYFAQASRRTWRIRLNEKNVGLPDASGPDTFYPTVPYAQMRLTPSLASAAFALYIPIYAIYALLPEPQSCGSLSEC